MFAPTAVGAANADNRQTIAWSQPGRASQAVEQLRTFFLSGVGKMWRVKIRRAYRLQRITGTLEAGTGGVTRDEG